MIVITGGAGVVGKRLVDGLLHKNPQEKIRLLALPGDKEAERMNKPGISIYFGNVIDESSLKGLFDGASTVYHLAALILSHGKEELLWKVNAQGTANVIRACEAAKVQHFILVSSASVQYRSSNAYSRSKIAAEDLVKQSRIPHWSIARPTLVYEQDGGQEFQLFARYLAAWPIIPFIGDGSAQKAPVHAQDLIIGLCEIAGQQKSYGKTYNFSGGEALSIIHIARLILNQMHKEKVIIHIPAWICILLSRLSEMTAKIFGGKPKLPWQTVSGILQHANLDNSEARIDLNFKPRAFSDGIKELRFKW